MSNTNDSNNDNHWLSSGSGSIADMVAEASRSFVTNEMLPGFTYNQEYDVYYNSTTGYYFDLKTSLYYHPNTRLYYSYDPETGTYKTFQHPNAQQSKWKSKKTLKRAERLFGRDYVDALDNEYADICLLLFDLIDKVDTIYGDRQTRKRAFANRNRVFDSELNDYVETDRLEISSDESSDEFEDDGEMQRRLAEEEANKHPPCIRLIEETNRNCLHIITIDGGFIGFGSKCDVSIGRAEGVAEKHAQILYNTDDASNPCYTIEPLNNGFPFHYNEHEIKKKMVVVLQHLDRLRIGPHFFAIHLHKGTNTCNSCEPGVLNSGNQGPSNTGERRRTHRQEMRAMKAKYGVFEPNENSTAKHRDRAAERREVFGSEPSIPKRRPQPQFPQVVAVQQPQPTTSTKIKSDNIGFKLLKNMGWQDGSGLGATNQGINAPIETKIKADRKGLGSNVQAPPMISAKDRKRLADAERMKLRYQEAEARQSGV
ncbi:G-patch domain-containing protein [Aphelenchoides besseyi]|nr:G-patch domain-containing protein [Aphelenchoides besseyi]